MITKLVEKTQKAITKRIEADPGNDKYKIYTVDKKTADPNVQIHEPQKTVGKYNVFRIQALKDFTCNGRSVKAGEFGGFIAGYDNLAAAGDCWVFDNAVVSGKALVSGDACIQDDALVEGYRTEVSGTSVIKDRARVYTGQIVDSDIEDDAIIAAICKESDLSNGNNDNGYIKAILNNRNTLERIGKGSPIIQGSVISGTSKILGPAFVDDSTVQDNAVVYGGTEKNSFVESDAIILGAYLSSCTVRKDSIVTKSYRRETLEEFVDM